MRRALLALVVAASLLLAGCTTDDPATATDDSPSPMTSPGSGGAESPTQTATETPGSVPSTATTTDSPTATAEPSTVEYRVRPGEIPAEFGSLEVTFRVVFVDDAGDLGPCYPDVFSGPFKPTLTPLPTPAAKCHESDPVTLDVTNVSGERSLGNFSAPGSTSGHALIATGVEATHTNGTAITTVNGMGGAELIRAEERPSGPYGVEVGIKPAPDGRSYDYWFVHDRYDPTE